MSGARARAAAPTHDPSRTVGPLHRDRNRRSWLATSTPTPGRRAVRQGRAVHAAHPRASRRAGPGADARDRGVRRRARPARSPSRRHDGWPTRAPRRIDRRRQVAPIRLPALRVRAPRLATARARRATPGRSCAPDRVRRPARCSPDLPVRAPRRGWWLDAGRQAQQRRLARAVLADQADAVGGGRGRRRTR